MTFCFGWKAPAIVPMPAPYIICVFLLNICYISRHVCLFVCLMIKILQALGDISGVASVLHGLGISI